MVGRFHQGPIDLALTVDESDFKRLFGSPDPQNFPAEVQALQFYRNGGDVLSVVRLDPGRPLATSLRGSLVPPRLRGLGALLPLSDLGLLMCPELTTLAAPEMAACLGQIEILGEGRPLFTLLDPPEGVTTSGEMLAWRNSHLANDLAHVAVYFPKLVVDPAAWSGGSSPARMTTGASGTVAAVIQENDDSRGVWKAPAGLSATFLAEGLSEELSSAVIADFNLAGINAIRDLPSHGKLIWGSRTLDTRPENQYLSVVRTRRWIVRSLEREFSDVPLRPNQSTLWADVEGRAEVFLNNLWREGGLAGATGSEAYYVKCGLGETMVAQDVAEHRVILELGCAFVRPAEFSISRIVLRSLDESLPGPAVPTLVSRPVDGVMHLRYQTFPGFVHRFQISSSLQPGLWFSGIEVVGDGSWIALEYPFDPSDSTYFRVETKSGWESP